MLYRRQRSVSTWLIVAVTAALAVPAGFLLGRLSAPRAELADLLEPSLGAVRDAQGSLDIVELEYRRALQASPDADAAARDASLTAAADAAARGLGRLQDASALAELYPAQVRDAEAAFERLHRDLVARVPLPQVNDTIAELRGRLADLRPAP